MIYGLYLSASGIAANSYRQDVIANNLANSETSGFK
jgi:flagellar basal body rod protein FlgG